MLRFELDADDSTIFFNWDNFDQDGDTELWEVANIDALGWTSLFSGNVADSDSWESGNPNSPMNPDNYLITKDPITLGSTSTIDFLMGSYQTNGTFLGDRLSIYLSNTNDPLVVSTLTPIFSQTVGDVCACDSAANNAVALNINASAFDGQTVYLVLRHHDTFDHNSVLVDNIGKKQIIKIIVQASSVPISYNGKYYLRSGSVVLELQGRELSDFLLKKSGITWDALEIDAKWEFEPDIKTFELFKKLSYDRLPFAKNENDVYVLIKKLNLLTPSLLPTKAAILLFDKNPQRYFPQAVIKIGRFINDAEIVSSDIVEGNLFQQAENALAILKTKYLISPITYEGVHRREKLQYPVEALREAIFNALIHRDYNTTSAVLIKIYNNSLSIANEGKLPPEITIADLKREHLSKPRNKLLADIFYKAGFIESWGRGTINIINECKTANIPEPNFYENHGVVKIIFELTDISKPKNSKLNGELNEQKDQILKKTVGETVGEILSILKKNPLATRNEISKKTGLSIRGVEWNLKILKDKGVIKRIGPNKGGHWEIL